jgi:hypothetical protein
VIILAVMRSDFAEGRWIFLPDQSAGSAAKKVVRHGAKMEAVGSAEMKNDIRTAANRADQMGVGF